MGSQKYAITITRQFGSLGRPIARRLSERLGIEYYDRDIVDAVAKKTGFSVSEISDMEESAKNGFISMKFPLGSSGTTAKQNELFAAQSQIISDIADKESCIIVGRCSDYVLRGHDRLINIYIYAPYEQRMKNCVDTLHLSPQEAKKMISDVDKARELYHVRYAGYLPQDENHKDILINSGFLGVEGTAEVLEYMIRKKLDLVIDEE
ncbi:MAG: cytidylate kinase-like family protein [Lachnospiraceae bacterium]|nr:cytidylate kinase-like family protein [Lachnospiraceae bacterium]